MKRLGRTWRRRAPLLAACVLFFAANLGFFFWYRGTMRERDLSLEVRRAALAAEVETAEKEAETLAAQARRLSAVSAAIEEFYGRRVGTRRQTLAAVVSELHAILNRVGIAPRDIGYSTTPVTDLPLSRMAIRFGFDADYSKLKSLLEAFEKGRRWIVVREISLARNPEVPGGVQVRVALATYFSDEEEDRRPARSAGGVAPAGRWEAP